DVRGERHPRVDQALQSLAPPFAPERRSSSNAGRAEMPDAGRHRYGQAREELRDKPLPVRGRKRG
ncbi:hypothetical protein, partial [Streptomyces xanthochromogenes]|uniref:hypothetical protein n=1 Tax=Streptomyces xanthochromogenes TaxID=67384 RepID=UPI0033190A9D